jgi:transcriptional regulator with XRE-family HTH domain
MIGEQLRQAIREGGFSQAALARETGLSEGQISRFLKGERGLSLESIDRLMDVLELEIVIRPRRKRKDG